MTASRSDKAFEIWHSRQDPSCRELVPACESYFAVPQIKVQQFLPVPNAF